MADNVGKNVRMGSKRYRDRARLSVILFRWSSLCSIATAWTSTSTRLSSRHGFRESPHCCTSIATPWCHYSYYRRSVSLASKAPEESNKNVDDDDDDDNTLEDLWMDGAFDELLFVEEPDAYLNDDDLSMLHDISIPSLSPPTNGNDTNQQQQQQRHPNVAIAGTRSTSINEEMPPRIISLQDLNKLKLSSDLSYFYLRDDLGLSEDAMWKITNEAGSVLGMKVSTVRNKVQVLRSTMSLPDEDIRSLITAQPSLLHLSAAKNLSPTILYLQRQLDLGTQELRTLVLGCPALLAYSIHNLQQKILFFRETMGFSVDECRKLLLQEPGLMTSNAETGLLPRLEFLHKEVNIPMESLRKIVQKNPSIFKMSVDRNLQPKLVFYFIMTLNLHPKEVQKILLNFPKILDYSLEDHLLPITRYFLSLDVSANEFARMLLKFPRLMTNSLVKIKHVVGYLRFELGLEANDVRRILYQAPQVVSLRSETIDGKVDFLLQAAAPGATRKSPSSTTILRRLIVGMPTLLYLSIDKNMGPKVAYLRDQLGTEALSSALDRLPMLLGYSLDKRIQPRLEKILNAGVDGGSITVGITMKEEAFDAWLVGRSRKAELGVTTGRARKTKGKAIKTKPAKDLALEPQEEGEEDAKGRVVQEGGRIVHWVRRS
jgi:hypothetical protein